MELEPKLIDVQVPEDPEGVVLVLHGGAARRDAVAVSPTQLSVVRMIPIARSIARAGHGRLAVFRLLNAQRGWNEGGEHTPVRDAAWALREIAARLGGGSAFPTVLVGHSLGGRAALMSVGRAGVRGVCALAPWVYATDVPPGLDGQQVLFVHGTDDRIADPKRSAALARAMASRAHVSYVAVRGGKHAMLGRRSQFDGLAAAFAATTLLGDVPAAKGPLAQIAAGEDWLTV